jgi:hydroxymethylbilane synthase
MSVVIGTRGSPLALAQARLVAERLDGPVELRVIRTAGDTSTAPLGELGDGVFVDAIERALCAGEIDVAVHSLKDLPTAERAELLIAAIPRREDPRDVLVTAGRGGLATLPLNAIVGTSSPRRAAFLRALVPGITTKEIRGNVETRLRKVAGGLYDATVLALAGLRRLGVTVAEQEVLTLVQCPPAPGQGALAVQCRRRDWPLARRLGSLDHIPSRLAVTAERALLSRLGASCALALGAYGRTSDLELVLDAALVTESGILRATARGADPLEIASRVAGLLAEPAHA